jgi:uncharacterized membrane protein YkvA (DUF1232 family)
MVSPAMTDENAIEPLPFESLSGQDVELELPGWYGRWRGRIHAWVSQRADMTVANLLTLLPDLLVLTVRLAKDPRVPFFAKAQLALAAAYVISPIDFLPEAALGVLGLTDDLTVLALVLYWLQSMNKIDREVLHDNWPGDGQVEAVIDHVHDRIMAEKDTILSHDVWQKIERRFSPQRREQRPRRLSNPLRRLRLKRGEPT